MNAPRTLLPVGLSPPLSLAEGEEDPPVRNAIAAERSATSRVHAPIQLAPPAAAEEEGDFPEVPLAVELVERLGTLMSMPVFFALEADSICPCSYTCGGVGHLSRDCVQGSKCYNCSGVVSVIPQHAPRSPADVLNVGSHQQGLPAAPEARLLHLWL